MITREQFLSLLHTQVETSVAYMGETWYEVWDRNAARNSIYREYAEFLDEVEKYWHCYKPNPTFDRDAAIFELVDIVHFMLTAMLIDAAPEELATDVNFPKSHGMTTSVMEQVEGSFTEFMCKQKPWHFAIFLNHACRFFGITETQYMAAHMAKNARNRVRAAGGVMDGKYDKGVEAPLVLSDLGI